METELHMHACHQNQKKLKTENNAKLNYIEHTHLLNSFKILSETISPKNSIFSVHIELEISFWIAKNAL